MVMRAAGDRLPSQEQAQKVAIATESMEGGNTWGVIYAINRDQDISSYRPVQILTPFAAHVLQEGSTVLEASRHSRSFTSSRFTKSWQREERDLYDTLNPGTSLRS